MPPEHLEEALGLLDPTHRALLELSLHREVADPALAELLRTDVDTVGKQRSKSLDRLADVLGSSPEDVESALVRHWRGEAEEAEEEPEPEPVAEEPEPDEPEPERAGVLEVGAKRGSRRGLWAVVAAGAAIALVLLLLLTGGGDDEESAAPPGTQTGGGSPPPPPPPPQEEGQPIQLQTVADGGNARGTARLLDDRRVELRVSGLTEVNHAVWLYNSIGDAKPLASFDGPEATSRFRLPENYERFRYLDISREPPDGNSNHSGESVLRIPTSELKPSP